MEQMNDKTKNSFWNTHSDKSRKFFRGMNYVFGIILLGVMLFWCYGQFVLKHPNVATEKPHYIDSEFDYYDKSGNVTKVRLPVSIGGLKLGDPVALKTTLPDDIEDGMILCYQGGRDTTIKIGDEVRLMHKGSDMKLPGKVSKAVYFFIPVSSADCGRELTIIKDEARSYNGNNNAILYGHANTIKAYIHNKYSIAFSLAFFMFVGAFLISCACWLIMKKSRGKLSVRLFSEGVMVVSAWAMCNSPGYQFTMNNYYIDGLIGYMLMPFVTIPFLGFFNAIQRRRHERIYIAILVFKLITYIPYICLHFFDILSFDVTRVTYNIFLIIELVLIMAVLAHDTINGYAKSYIVVVWGIGILVVCAIAEMILINTHHDPNGMVVLSGLLIATGCATVNSFREYMAMEDDKARALRASVLKTNFLTNMSHEIRTPINSIVGMNQMILQEAKESNVVEYAKYIDRSSKILLGLINDVLDFSKIEAGKVVSNKEAYDTAKMLCMLADTLEERASNKNLMPIIKVDDNIPDKLYGDEQHIEQIVLNLISNATKYTKEGSVSFEVSAQYLSDEKINLSFKVSDTGIGIEKENIGRIFDSFSRVDEKNNRNIQGTGLGLAITKDLVNALNGEIKVSSEYGVGSEFIVTIPQTILSTDTIGTKWRAGSSEEPVEDVARDEFVAPNASILAVDDNVANLMIITQFLKKTEAKVDTASNGVEAVNMAKEKTYDIILLDHMMPIMDGIEANKHIRGDEDSLNRYTPVIVLTANAIAGSREEYLAEGFADYLTKPVKYDVFIKTICNFLPDDKVECISCAEASDAVVLEEKPDEAGEKEYSLDMDKLVSIYGDEGFAKEIVYKVASDTIDALDRMHKSYEEKDYDKYRIDAHGIKGMMASIYVAPLQEWAKKHEFSVKENTLGYIDEDLDTFDKAIRDFCNEIINNSQEI